MAKKKKAAKKAKKTRKAAKRPARKAKPKAKKRAGKAAKAKASRPKAPKLPPGITLEKHVPEGKLLGLVDDYYSHVNVVVLTLKAPLSIGDTIRVKGHTTDITQKVESMQINHASVPSASAGDAVGVMVAARARKGDAVYKV